MPGTNAAAVHGAALYGGSARSFANFLRAGFLNCNSTGNAGSNFSSAASFLTEQPPAVFLYLSSLPVQNFDSRFVAVWPVPFVVYLDADFECCQ